MGKIVREYGEEKHWRLLARRICESRIEAPITTTHELVKALGRVPGVKGGRSGGVFPRDAAFQRAASPVRDELRAVEEAVPAAIDALAPGGRLAIITFHSLEDKIVKTAFREAAGQLNAQPDRPFSAWERQPPPPEKRVRLVDAQTNRRRRRGGDENVRARSWARASARNSRRRVETCVCVLYHLYHLYYRTYDRRGS